VIVLSDGRDAGVKARVDGDAPRHETGAALPLGHPRRLVWVGEPEEAAMPPDLTRLGSTPATWARSIESPEDRRHAARPCLASAGRTLRGF